MGYRSEWKLAVRGEPENLNKLHEFFIEKLNLCFKPTAIDLFLDKKKLTSFSDIQQLLADLENDNKLTKILEQARHTETFGDENSAHALFGYSRLSVYVYILGSMTSEDKDLITFGHDFTKCYTPWDEVITELFSTCDRFGLQAAYTRIGEEQEDMDHRENSDLLWYPLIREIGDLEIESNKQETTNETTK